jgi:hypothetical protein
VTNKTATRCVPCSVKHKKPSQRKVERPKKEVLFSLVLKHPFTQLSEMFNVSDNAIRKWCKLYGIPFKKNEIKAIFSGDFPLLSLET